MKEEEFLKQTHIVFYIQGSDVMGKNIHAFLAVKAEKLLAFLRAVECFPIALDEYGKILATGEGLPSQETRHRMITDYGFDETNMIAIPPHA